MDIKSGSKNYNIGKKCSASITVYFHTGTLLNEIIEIYSFSKNPEDKEAWLNNEQINFILNSHKIINNDK